MTDFATLVLGADTSGLKKGEEALDRIAPAGARAEKAADGVAKAFDTAGASAGKSALSVSEYEIAMKKARAALGMQVRSFEDLRLAVDPAYAAQKKWTEIQRVSSAAVKAGEASQREANIVLQEAQRRYLGVIPVAEQLAQAERELAAQNQSMRATYESTLASLDPLYASSKRYEQVERQLAQALKAGVITQKEHARSLGLASDRYLVSAKNADVLANKASGLGRRFNASSHEVRSFGMQLSQVAQQGAVTGDYLTAATIQAADIGLAFGAAGIAVGALVSVAGPAVISMLRGTDSSKKFQEGMDALSQSVSDYKNYADLASASTDDLAERFGTSAGAVGNIASVLSDISRSEAVKKLNEEVAGLTEQFGGLDPDKTVFRRIGGMMSELDATYAELRKELELTEAQADAVVGSLYRLGKSDAVGEQVNQAEQLVESWKAVFGTIDDIPDPLQKVIVQAGQLAVKAGEIVSKEEAMALLADRRKVIAAELVAKYDQQAALQNAIAMYGADSAQAEAIKRSEAVRAVNALIDQKQLAGGVAVSVRDAALAAYDAQINAANAANALRDAETAAKGLAQAIAAAAGFSDNLENGIRVLKAEVNALETGANAALAAEIERQKIIVESRRNAAIAAGEDRLVAKARAALDMDAIDEYEREAVKKANLIKLNQAAAKSAKSASSVATKAMKEQEKAAAELAKKIQQIEWDADPVKKYAAQVKDLDLLLDAGLSNGAYTHAIAGFNDELAASLPLVDGVRDSFADFLLDGAKDFKSFTDSVFDQFKTLIANMIATAGRNKIMLGLGLTGGTGLGLAGATSGLSSGLGSLAGSVASVTSGLGAVGAALGDFGGGTLAGLSGLASGGLSGYAGTVSASAANAGLASTLGAVLGPVALAAAGVYAAKGLFGTKERNITIDQNALELVATGAAYQPRDYVDAAYGNLRTVGRGNDGVGGNVVSKKWLDNNEFNAAITDARAALFDVADVFGVTSREITRATSEFQYAQEVVLDGLSDAEKAAAISSFVVDSTNALADLVPELAGFARSGEGTYEALVEMHNALTLVNATSTALGDTLLDVSAAGGDAARSIIEAFGDATAYSSAVGNYVGLFFDEAAQLDFAVSGLTSTLDTLGATMPRTRTAYMDMIDAADLTTDSGRALYAALVGLATQFDTVLPAVEGFTTAMATIAGTALTGVEVMISEAASSASAAETAAKNWYAASLTLRDFIDDLNGAQARESGINALTSQMESTFSAALGGDVESARDFTGIASDYLTAAKAQAVTQVDYLRAQADIASRANLLAGVSELEGATKDVMQTLYEEQITILESLQSALSAGTVVTEDGLDAISAELGGIQAAIADAEGLTYASLMKRLTVAVDLIPSADIPEDLAALISTAASGIESTIAFAVLADDLTPDLRWLAVNGSSEHIKTLDFVLGEDLDNGTRMIALGAVSDLDKTVNLLLGASLTHDEMTVALSGNSELSRVVNVALASDASKKAIKLALGNVSDYTVAVQASLADGISKKVRKIVFGGSGTYSAMIEAAFSPDLSKAARLALLEQQGTYAVTIGAVLADDIPNKTRKLLINSATSAVRGVTVALAFGDDLGKKEKALLLESSTSLLKTVTASVDLTSVKGLSRGFLSDIVDGAKDIKRTIKGAVDLSSLSGNQKALLSAISGSASGLVTLGGSFKFDPSKSFQSWFEGAATGAITDPMGALRSSIEDLTSLMAREAKLSALSAEITTLQSERSSIIGQAQSIIGQITDLEAATGVSLINGGSDAILAASEARSGIKYKATGVSYGAGADIAAFTSAFWAAGGLEDQLQALTGAPLDLYKQINKLQKKYDRLLDGVPGFASGGSHMGGLRIVGESGPELEATGPSRIWNAGQTAQMLGGGSNAEIAAELRAMRRENKDLAKQNKALLAAIEKSSRESADWARNQDRTARINA